MSARIFVLLAVLIVVVSAAAVPDRLTARAASLRCVSPRSASTTGVRSSRCRSAQADGAWGERRLPRSRFFPASATVDRWLASSALSVERGRACVSLRDLICRRTHGVRCSRSVRRTGSGASSEAAPVALLPGSAAVGRWLASSALTVRAPTLDVDVDLVRVEVRIATQLVLDGRMDSRSRSVRRTGSGASGGCPGRGSSRRPGSRSLAREFGADGERARRRQRRGRGRGARRRAAPRRRIAWSSRFRNVRRTGSGPNGGYLGGATSRRSRRGRPLAEQHAADGECPALHTRLHHTRNQLSGSLYRHGWANWAEPRTG